MERTALETKNKVVGLKQTLRALQQNKALTVYIAGDIDDHIRRKIETACQGKEGVKVVPLKITQKELGRMCGIEVSASVVALLRN